MPSSQLTDEEQGAQREVEAESALCVFRWKVFLLLICFRFPRDLVCTHSSPDRQNSLELIDSRRTAPDFVARKS